MCYIYFDRGKRICFLYEVIIFSNVRFVSNKNSIKGTIKLKIKAYNDDGFKSKNNIEFYDVRHANFVLAYLHHLLFVILIKI